MLIYPAKSFSLRQGVSCYTDQMKGEVGGTPSNFITLQNTAGWAGLNGLGAFHFAGYNVDDNNPMSRFRYENLLEDVPGVWFDMTLTWNITAYASPNGNQQGFYLAVSRDANNQTPFTDKVIYWRIEPTGTLLRYAYSTGFANNYTGPNLINSEEGEGLSLAGSIRFTWERQANGSADIVLYYKQTGYHTEWQTRASYNVQAATIHPPSYIHWGVQNGLSSGLRGITGSVDSIVSEGINVDCPGT